MQKEINNAKMVKVKLEREELDFSSEEDFAIAIHVKTRRLKSSEPTTESKKIRFLPTEPQLHQDEKALSTNLELSLPVSPNDNSHSQNEGEFMPSYSDREDSILGVYLHQIRQIPILSKAQEKSLFIRIEKNQKIITELIAELKSLFPDVEKDWEQLTATEMQQFVGDLIGQEYPPSQKVDVNTRRYLQYLIGTIARSQRQIQVAQNRIVESNLRLVVCIAKRYNARGLTLLDLIQEGSTGLMKAVERFEYQRGAKFSAYASFWIQQAIGHAIANQDRVIRLPAYVGEILRKVRRASEQFRKEKYRKPNNKEIAEITGLSQLTLEKLSKTAMDVYSLDDFIGEDEEESKLSFIEDEQIPTPEQQVTMKCLQDELKQALNSLPPREEQIIRLRYGLDDGHSYSLREIGTLFNLSRERVRQLESRALDRLRHPTRSAKLQEFLMA